MKLKSFICSFSFLTLGFNTTNYSLNTVNPNLMYKSLKESIALWNDTNCSLDFSFNYKDNNYKLYSLEKENYYKGYFVVNSLGKVVTIYVGEKRIEDYSNLSSISPLFSEGESYLQEQSNSNIVSTVSNQTLLIPPTLNVDIYASSYSSFNSEQLLKDCPTYFNPNGYMCSPTAGAMLISFYDRYSNLNNLYDGLLDLDQGQDNLRVQQLIHLLAVYMGTISSGTTPSGRENGLTNYLKDKGYSSYRADTVEDYTLYSTLINKYNVPSIVRVEFDSVIHAVLGIGTASIKDVGNYFICHYGEYNHNLGDYYLPKSYFKGATYIGR